MVVAMVIVIKSVIGGFSWVDLVWLALKYLVKNNAVLLYNHILPAFIMITIIMK